jgi:hypothetical protein
MSRETLKDFLNKKGSTQDMLTYSVDEKTGDLSKDTGTDLDLLDLDDDTVGLLGDYVRFIMEEEGNEHIPSPGNEKAASSNKGDDLVLADLQGFESVHVEQGSELKQKLNEYSNSGKFDNLSNLIDKVGKNFSNHKKLQDIKGRDHSSNGETTTNPQGEENDIIQSSQKMFLKNNRFTNVGSKKSDPFAPKNTNIQSFEKEYEDKTDNSGTIAVQSLFGEYSKDKIITNSKLKEIGVSLLLKSSGFSKSGDEKEKSVEDVINNINADTSTLFNLSPDFKKQEVNQTYAKNAHGFPTDGLGNSIRDGRGSFIASDPDANNSKTYGTTYNSYFKFTGPTQKLHKMQAAISMIMLKNVGKTFYESFISSLRLADKVDIVSEVEKYAVEKPHKDLISFIKGKSNTSRSNRLNFSIFETLLTNTTHSYGDAVDRGIDIIFGTSGEDNKDSVANHKNLAMSPGFWLAVSRSALKSLDNLNTDLLSGIDSDTSAEELFLLYKDIVDSNKFIQFFNVLAIIGDASLSAKSGSKNKNYNNVRDVDNIPDNRAIPGKSRKKNGRYKEELAWDQDASPSMYLLPANVIRAAAKLNSVVEGVNPARGMFGSKIGKFTYAGLDVDGSYNRIPNDVVKIVEDKLEAEYVPFYIQDLRTNEIVSFNAFLDTLSDTISPNYTSVDGYGRMDSVKIYQGTSRSMQVGFTLFATNREDFDSMWFKINKLVTLLYPQWTPGTMVSNKAGSKFYQPFSQVVGASPIVRMRIGDVVKSNYSRFNLARIFGIGDTSVDARSDIGLNNDRLKFSYDVVTELVLKGWLAAFGSPLSTLNSVSNLINVDNPYAKIVKKYGVSAAAEGIVGAMNGFVEDALFVNPLAVKDFMNRLKDPNLDPSDPKLGYKGDYKHYANYFSQCVLRPNVQNGYICAKTGKRHLITRKLKARIVKKDFMNKLSDDISGLPSDVIGYKVLCIDYDAPHELLGGSKELIVRHQDIYPDPKLLFNSSTMGKVMMGADSLMSIVDMSLEDTIAKSVSAGIPGELFDMGKLLTSRQESLFMNPVVNPYTKALESTMGRGIAGVLQNITFNWIQDFPWEVEHNSRAPIGVKISFGFDVIHDLPPGIDHTGFNRAPLYNVGGIMKNLSGDPYEDNGRKATSLFKKEGAKVATTKGSKNG